jgi:hypothetical protein
MPIVAMPDGTNVSFPDDMPKRQIAGLIASKFPKDTGSDKGEYRASLQGFNATVPFGERIVAGMSAGVAAPFADESIGELYSQARSNQKATETSNPNAYLGGNLAGAAMTLPIGLSKTVANPSAIGNIANGLNKASSTIGNFVRGGEVAKDAGTLAKLGNVGLQSAKGAGVAGATGALYGYGGSKNDLNSPEALRDAATVGGYSAAVGGAIPVLGAGAGAAIGAILPKIDDGLADAAALARKYKIPLSLDQVTNNPALKNVQKVSQELPLSGQQGFREKQMRAYNRAIFNTVGVQAETFTPKTMEQAFSKVGGEFDAVTKGKLFNIGGDFIDNLTQSADEIASAYGKEAADTFQKEAARVINDFKGDTVTGELISRQRARINALARKASQGQKEALLELENNIVDGITSGDPAVQQALSQAKQRYKNLIVLEPIANKSKGGFISPSQLNTRVSQVYKRAHTIGNSGEIGDLARIGNELLPALGGSDTTQKLLTAGAMFNAAINPISAVPVAGALAANRVVQSFVNRNQGLIDKTIAKQSTKQPLRINIKPTADEYKRLNGGKK